MSRRLCNLLAVGAVAALASFGVVGVAPTGAGVAPVSGSGTAYTVTLQAPNGIFAERCRLATIDLATGAVTPVGPVTTDQLGCAFDLAFSPGGVLYGIADLDGEEVDPPAVDETIPTTEAPVTPAAPLGQVHLVRYDTTTGAHTDLGGIGTALSYVNGAGGLTFDAGGNLYVYLVSDDPQCDGDAYCLYRVDPANPADATFLGADPGETYLFGLTSSCNAGLFTIEDASRTGSVESVEDVLALNGGNQLDAVDPNPPAKATAVGGLIGRGRTIQSIDFAADGTLWALGSTTPLGLPSAQLSVLDPATGAQTMGPALVSGDDATLLAFGLAVSTPSCPVDIQPNFTG